MATTRTREEIQADIKRAELPEVRCKYHPDGGLIPSEQLTTDTFTRYRYTTGYTKTSESDTTRYVDKDDGRGFNYGGYTTGSESYTYEYHGYLVCAGCGARSSNTPHRIGSYTNKTTYYSKSEGSGTRDDPKYWHEYSNDESYGVHVKSFTISSNSAVVTYDIEYYTYNGKTFKDSTSHSTTTQSISMPLNVNINHLGPAVNTGKLNSLKNELTQALARDEAIKEFDLRANAIKAGDSIVSSILTEANAQLTIIKNNAGTNAEVYTTRLDIYNNLNTATALLTDIDNRLKAANNASLLIVLDNKLEELKQKVGESSPMYLTRKNTLYNLHVQYPDVAFMTKIKESTERSYRTLPDITTYNNRYNEFFTTGKNNYQESLVSIAEVRKKLIDKENEVNGVSGHVVDSSLS